MKLNYTLETRLDFDVIDQVLKLETDDPVRGAVQEVTHWVVDTREKGIRDALIALGWTPPKNNPPAAGEGEL